ESEQALDVSADISKNRASRNFDLMINMTTSVHINSDLLHQMMSDHISSDLAPQRQMVSAENNTSGPVPQGSDDAPFLNVLMTFEQRSSSLVLHQMMSDHISSDLAPQRQMVSAENNTSGPVPQCSDDV
ncbi:hypothetical protein Tco_0176460, partial [Tanacetum coccineum]